MLAAVQLRHWLFGKRYVSMPFCDWTGILADDEKTECRLLRNVLLDAQVQRIGFIELRQNRPLVLAQAPAGSIDIEGTSWTFSDANSDNKVRMLLDLPDDADALMRGFRSKLRSQIRKPFKEGLVVRRERGCAIWSRIFTVSLQRTCAILVSFRNCHSCGFCLRK